MVLAILSTRGVAALTAMAAQIDSGAILMALAGYCVAQMPPPVRNFEAPAKVGRGAAFPGHRSRYLVGTPISSVRQHLFPPKDASSGLDPHQ
jgi:hypothetical protein